MVAHLGIIRSEIPYTFNASTYSAHLALPFVFELLIFLPSLFPSSSSPLWLSWIRETLPRTYEQYNTAAVFSLDEVEWPPIPVVLYPVPLESIRVIFSKIPPLSIPRQLCAESFRSRKDQFSHVKPPKHRLAERGQEVSVLPSIEFINQFEGSVCGLQSASLLFRHLRFNSLRALPHIESVQRISQTAPLSL